jgi:hypothetical protein
MLRRIQRRAKEKVIQRKKVIFEAKDKKRTSES